jgi:carboxynorspermidine decarboxylase
MNVLLIKQKIPSSPAFLIDQAQIQANLQVLVALREATGCKLLYSIKALPLIWLIDLIKDTLDGVAVSSLFEARLARERLGERGHIHITTPGLRQNEFVELGNYCTHIGFNSLQQFQTLHISDGSYLPGLRINTKLSYARDIRYDPCRAFSKLGIDINALHGDLPKEITGLHFHTVFGCSDFLPFEKNIKAIIPLLQRNPQLKWLNLGGGYLFPEISDLSPFIDQIKKIKSEFAVDIYLEPGKALLAQAGYLLTTVLDRFNSDGKTVLILDSSVNHHPEVFEYQMSPFLLEDAPGAKYSAILAGSSCMAGDIFGEYSFHCLPEIGDRVIFGNVGPYSLVKAQRFNGYNLPDIYRVDQDKPGLLKQYEYVDYRRQWQCFE